MVSIKAFVWAEFFCNNTGLLEVEHCVVLVGDDWLWLIQIYINRPCLRDKSMKLPINLLPILPKLADNHNKEQDKVGSSIQN